jgi:hypothetical protein
MRDGEGSVLVASLSVSPVPNHFFPQLALIWIRRCYLFEERSSFVLYLSAKFNIQYAAMSKKVLGLFVTPDGNVPLNKYSTWI